MVYVKAMHRESVPEFRFMLQRHARYTGSTVAQGILNTWDESLPKFKRVMPRAYARVLRELRADETEWMSHVPE